MALADELAVLREAWAVGTRDIGTARRLLYVLWSASVEPSFVTGIDQVPGADVLRSELVRTVLDSAENDFESALVLGYLIWFAPWFFGPDEDWLPKARACLERALEMARQQGRSAQELGQIEFYIGAAQTKTPNQPPASGEGCFPDLFRGESAYDKYFAWIFAGRQTASGEQSRKVTSEVLAALERAERKETRAAVKDVLLSPLQPSGAMVLSVFFALGLLVSIPSLNRSDVVMAHYASVFYVIVLIRLAYGVVQGNLRPVDCFLWAGAFAVFRIVAEYL